MKFYDKVKIKVTSGKGGNGVASARREARVPYGGPSGGDGGDGGDIILQADEGMNTLMKYRHEKHFKAPRGEHGRSKDQYGKSGKDQILNVPVGTIVKDVETDKVLYQFLKDGEKKVIAQGGKGGYGNIHFKNSTRQFPNMFLKGEPGQTKKIILELQLLGDLALIGAPSVGKSSIINMISNVQAKTANYHFTTLVPKIGIVNKESNSFSVVDIPGLIKGASEGKGLGNQFLRHVLKAKVWTFVLDMDRYEQGIDEFIKIFGEIKDYVFERFQDSMEFGEKIVNLDWQVDIQDNNLVVKVYGDSKQRDEPKLILKKVLYLALNKYDLVDDKEILGEYQKYLEKRILDFLEKDFVGESVEQLKEKIASSQSVISTYTKKGIDKFVQRISYTIKDADTMGVKDYDHIKVDKKQKNYIKDITDEKMQDLIEKGYIDKENGKFAKLWEVYNPQLAYYVYVLPWENPQAVDRFWEQLRQEGILQWFEQNGVYKGDILQIKSPYSTKDDKYIMYR